MQVAVEKAGSYLRKVSITIPAGDVDTAFSRVYGEIAKSAKLPGFRPGKIPRGLIEKRFAAEASSEVKNKLVQESLYRAMMENEVEAVGIPQLTMGDLARGEVFSYTAEVEVRPDVELVKYKGLSVPKIDVSVPDAEFDGELDRLRERAVQLVPVLVRDIVQQGDVVQVDFEGFIGGIPFDGGKAENAMVEIGGEGYIPGFADALEGAKVPSEREISVTFPENYNAAELAGKDATFQVKLKELKTKELPALDDDFAKDLGEESLEALKEKVRKAIGDRKKEEGDGRRRKAILEGLVEGNPIELPPSMVTEQADAMVRQGTERVQAMLGQRLNFSADELARMRADSMESARQQVAGSLLLVEVGRAEGLEVGDDEIAAEVERIVEEAGERAEEARSQLQGDEGREGIKYRLLEEKIFSFLFEHAIETESIEPAAEQGADVEAPTEAQETSAGGEEG